MTEITDLSPTDSNNTAVSGESLDGAIANMGRMDNTLQAILGMFGRWTSSDTIASAGTTDIGAQAEAYLTVSGTTTITSFGTVRAGTIRFLRFSGILTLTYNATSMILPGAASITTAADDTAVLVSEGSGNWRCLIYQRANGQAVIAGAAKTDVRRNRVVNHDMRVSQENGITSGTTNGFYPVDQWAQYRVTSAGVLTIAQVASVTPAGSPNRLRATVTTADASLAAGEYWTISQNLEGSNVADFQYGGASAKNSVLRFGFKGPAGTYAARLGNSAANRSYVALFTITAPQANTDTVQTISVVGDTSGTWLTTDGVIGITLDIVLAAGTTFQGAAGWQAGNILATSAISNGMGTVAAVFELFDVGLRLDPDATGVYGQYEVGEVNAFYRSERYWEKSYNPTVAPGTITDVGALAARSSVTNFACPIRFVTSKSKSPSVTTYSTANGISGVVYDVSGVNNVASSIDNLGIAGVNISAGTSSGALVRFHYIANARLT